MVYMTIAEKREETYLYFFRTMSKILLFIERSQEREQLGFVPFEEATIKIYNSGDVQ